ncbi:MAG: phosphoribosylanthranilate isomerase, partial [Dysgonamonadaceae bacterium]|nr:phosphoribosylanthranilate isomerase [Dysgonamonadaceae bacterium]
MKIKVCGMKNPQNISELAQLPVDLMGLIFYEKSPRYVENLDPKMVRSLPASIQKVGVFVNASMETISEKIRQYDLQFVQLHGNESPVFCKELKASGVQVIKAFPIENAKDLTLSVLYAGVCDYYLFDTKTPDYGGSGEKFDWQLLAGYTGTTPFFLSGGIAPEDMEAIHRLQLTNLYAIDLN